MCITANIDLGNQFALCVVELYWNSEQHFSPPFFCENSIVNLLHLHKLLEDLPENSGLLYATEEDS